MHSLVRMLIRYLRDLNTGRTILWCYLIWYLVTLVKYFDPRPSLWVTSIGLSGVIGFALYISTTSGVGKKTKLDRWQVFRLFLMPFCVSSFSALVKDRGFILILSPQWQENALALGLICVFLLVVFSIKRFFPAPSATLPGRPAAL